MDLPFKLDLHWLDFITPLVGRPYCRIKSLGELYVPTAVRATIPPYVAQWIPTTTLLTALAGNDHGLCPPFSR